MLEHLTNCHGEWNFLLAAIGSIPFIGAWASLHLQRLRKKVKKDECR